MRAIAEFAMKKPFNAYALAAVSAAFPFLFWLSAALVGLVTLRRGQSQGITVLVAAIIGALAGLIYVGEIVAYMPVLLSCSAIVLLASVLRSTMSWAYTLISGTGIAILFGILAVTFVGDTFNAMIQQIIIQLDAMPESNDAMRQIFVDMAENNGLALVFAGGSVDLAIVILMLARSWQSGLYNPGGFRKEFHELRLKPWMIAALVLIALAISQINVYALEPAIMPLLISGIALVHCLMAKRDMGGPWLFIFYIGMLLVPYMLPLVVIAAAIDSVADLRRFVSEANNG